MITLVRKNMLATIEVEVDKSDDEWVVSIVAYGDWFDKRFSNYLDVIKYIEVYIPITDDEKDVIRNL